MPPLSLDHLENTDAPVDFDTISRRRDCHTAAIEKPVNTLDGVLALLRLARWEAEAGAAIGLVRALLVRKKDGLEKLRAG